MGDEKIFLVLATRHQINSTSLFKKEIYAALTVYFEIGLYHHNNERQARMEKDLEKESIRRMLFMYPSLDHPKFFNLCLDDVKAVFEFYAVGLVICILIKAIEYKWQVTKTRFLFWETKEIMQELFYKPKQQIK